MSPTSFCIHKLTLFRREEILAIADSPDDIGPPPVSQFVDEDPVKIDLPRRTKKDENEEPQALDPTLSVNLEQRRRRKDSTAPSELSRLSKVEEPQASREGTTSVRIGAKRKLSVREDEEVPARPEAASPDDFKYTRVISEEGPRKSLSENAVRKVTKDLNASNEGAKEKVPAATITTTRKILAPKSVNDSPRKMVKVISEDGKPGKGDSVKPITAKDRPKERKPELVKISPPPEPMGETIEVQLEPETPAATDLFSPLSSQPSTARVESRDTPPPVDLGSEAEGHRPSRRARGAVSYAEPNLRDKMRRPTKELVDAVGKDGKPHRENAIKLESDIASEPKDPTIKPEPEADDAWKQMPVATSTTVENSPLGSKAPVPELLPSSITTHRRRRESLLNNMDLDSARPSSATAIAALLAESRKAKAAAREKAAESDALLARTNAPLDIYEFKGSSPASEEFIQQPVKTEKSVPPRFSRRQSTAVRNTPTPEEGEASDMEAPKRSVSASISSRRQSALGLRSTSASSIRPSDRDKDNGKSLKRSTSATAMPDAATNSTASRNERIAARRRSMML